VWADQYSINVGDFQNLIKVVNRWLGFNIEDQRKVFIHSGAVIDLYNEAEIQ